MTIRLPEDLQHFVKVQVQSGRFASEDEAIAEAVRLMREYPDQTQSNDRALTEEEFDRQLVNRGILAPRTVTKPAPKPFQAIKVEGEPLSETIIRERR